ncbi:MAG: 2Fe-2S iron-sulfur cluster binding domain-containing protein [Proteobacteria bacterium]|nr:MAG: 2Fe-2S iron-sulfur cluster binding domain-containing protein [Pseudomonadota bacterium]
MAEVKIIFTMNNQKFETTMSAHESVLEAAMKAGINPPYSCLEGVCGSCVGFLEEGEVDSVEGHLSASSSDRLFRTCQAQPKSNNLHVNYDKAPA